ncbi:hypothetical protein BC938DRAFT_475042, partial [Jimgerdemannia flammicorona]
LDVHSHLRLLFPQIYPEFLSSDIWSKASGLVSLDSLGKPLEVKQSVGPSMNSLASTNATASSTWNAWASTAPGGGMGAGAGAGAAGKKPTKQDFDDLLM